MAEFKIVVFSEDPADPLHHERSEMADLDVEFSVEKPSSEGEAIEAVKDADAIMIRGAWGTEQVIRSASKAKVLAVYSHGFNNIDVDACNEMGIILTNSAAMCAEEVSNQAVTMCLALNRQIVQSTNQLRIGNWDRKHFEPIEPIDEQTLGIIGFGNIGRQIARKLGSGWRMDTLVYDPYIPPWIIKEAGVTQVFGINEICRKSDYLVTIVPLNKETFHMIGKDQFKNMKTSSFFVNVCRGSVVDEEALIDALNQNEIRGAGFDVFEQEPVDPSTPLLQMENVITAPHIAGSSTRAAWLSRQRASQQVRSVLIGEWPMAGQNPEVINKLDRKKQAIGGAGKLTGTPE